MTAILKTESISKHYGGFRALNDVSFEVARGETLAIIGPNGAGKTTLFKVITGEVPTTAGKIIFRDHDISDQPAYVRSKLGMGRTFQIVRVFGQYTALENVVVALESRARTRRPGPLQLMRVKPRPELLDEAVQFLDRLGLAGELHTVAEYLSLGDRKRLELAVTLALEPELLLLDEPTAGMSPTERVSIVGLIHRIREMYALTIVLTEHDMDFVFSLSQRVAVMNLGEVIAIGEPDAIRSDERVRDIYLGRRG